MICDATDTSNSYLSYYWYYSNFVSSTDTSEFYHDIDYFYLGLLMYKGWMTVGEYLRYLYIKRVYKRMYSGKGFFDVILKRKTNRSTTPIRRYKPVNRK